MAGSQVGGGENAEKDPQKPFKLAESRHFSPIFRSLLKAVQGRYGGLSDNQTRLRYAP
jgi:hypothetical protein